MSGGEGTLPVDSVEERISPAHQLSRLRLPAAVLLSSTALLVVLWGLFQLDYPVARYVRSLHVPWVEFLGDLAHRMGSGPVLVVLTVALMAAGWHLRKPLWQQAGRDALIAHGAVAVLVQSLKHLVGRPRPRLMHGDEFALGPTLDSGLDSFPSGHSSASFTVAVVLARYFPRAGWLFYLLAALVALSRVVRGSHYPTDVVAGAAIGLLVGAVVVQSLREWRQSLLTALLSLAPGLVVVFGLLWVALRVPSPGSGERLLLAVGLLMLGGGLVLRLWREGGREHWRPLTPVLFGVGLGLTTGSLLVSVLALFAMAGWALGQTPPLEPRLERTARGRAVGGLALVAAILLAVFLIQVLRGLLPLL